MIRTPPGFADRYAVRPADTHAIGQGGRPLQAGDAGFRVVRPNTVVQRFPCILPDRRDSVLGGLPFQVGRGWRTGGRRAGIVRGPYLPGQQHLLIVNVAMEGHQPDVDGCCPPGVGGGVDGPGADVRMAWASLRGSPLSLSGIQECDPENAPGTDVDATEVDDDRLAVIAHGDIS